MSPPPAQRPTASRQPDSSLRWSAVFSGWVRLALLAVGVGASLAVPTWAQDGYVFSTLAGRVGVAGSADGTLSTALFNSPHGVCLDWSGAVCVTDWGNATIRRISPTGVTTLAGAASLAGQVDGFGSAARFGSLIASPLISSTSGFSTSFGPVTIRFLVNGPDGITQDPSGAFIIVDSGATTLRRCKDGAVTTLAGAFQSSSYTYTETNGPPFLVSTPPPLHQSVDGTGAQARFMAPFGVTVDASGIAYVTDANAHTIRRIEENVVTTLAGGVGVAGSNDGPRLAARFRGPAGIVADRAGNLFVLDSNNGTVRKITSAGEVTTLAGTAGESGSADGNGAAARFGLAPASTVTPSLVDDLISRSPPYLLGPRGVALEKSGNLLIVDTANATLRRLTPGGVVTTIAGKAGETGGTNGPGPSARFLAPQGIVVDDAGNLYVTDTGNHTIRKGVPAYLPRFESHPANQTLLAGDTLRLAATTASNTLAVSYQWMKDGQSLAGATAASLTLANVLTAQAGRYTVVATNDLGSVTSNPATVVVGALPVITTAPASVTVPGGQSIELSVVASSSPAPTYQWQKDGRDLPGATNASLRLTAAQAADAGAYRVVVSNPSGAVTTPAATVAVNGSRLVNLSIRSVISPSAPMLTVGFVVAGEAKNLLVRAIGPALGQFGVRDFLADPRISVFNGTAAVAANDDWTTAANRAEVVTTAAGIGAFALPGGSADSALLQTFAHGGYSAQVTAPATHQGVVLVELYDANPAIAARLVNVSTRAQVGTGDSILVAGFAISGNARQTLLIRAVGPTLGAFGVNGTLADPKLEVFAQGSALPLASNDDWGGGPTLTAAFAAQGAFPLSAANSKDSALLVTLDPGTYSVQVTGVGATTGEALIEIYEVR